jgi:hypothetical protein
METTIDSSKYGISQEAGAVRVPAAWIRSHKMVGQE